SCCRGPPTTKARPLSTPGPPHGPGPRRRRGRGRPAEIINPDAQEVAALREPADTAASPVDADRLFDLTDRVAVITGATRGLGLAMARAFATAGAQVVVVSRKADVCAEVAAALRAEGGKAAACACHVGRWDDLATLVENVYRDYARVDVLVNNAGLSPVYGKLTEVSEELFDKVIA